MYKKVWLAAAALMVLFTACDGGNAAVPPVPLTPEQQVLAHLDTLKARAQEGDLVVRLTDDIVSDVIRNMNDSDKVFSHAGIVVMEGNRKMVCNITPDDKENTGADTIRYEPLDSFMNPQYSLKGGLFRYALQETERQVFMATLDSFKHLRPRFDEQYNYATDNKMYCSEMIAKALTKATAGRINCGQIYLPEKMVKLFKIYYKKYNYSEEQIRKVPYVPIDNLYRVSGCTELMRIQLKYMQQDAGS
jgi:Permuted papain-like amidase enzyme, YaeF/YiiX, C92 family